MGFFRRCLLAVLLWPLPFTLALGQATSGAFELKGVLISPGSRSALINGEVAGEGDVVDGAEILSIGEKSVSIRVGLHEYSILVGSATAVLSSPAVPRRSVAVHRSVYTVRRGDTLSGIAERFAGDGITMNQVMVALFEANPDAFDGNINLVRAGAILQVPPAEAIRSHSIAAATSEVLRQTDAWRAGTPGPAPAVARQEYGPVTGGETLSGIATSVLRDDVSLNRMMMALFEANPHAFDGNINRLRKGMLLRIPGSSEIRRWTHATATAEVVRHAESWRSRYARDLRPTDRLMTALNVAAAAGPAPDR